MPLKQSWQLVVNELKSRYMALLGNVVLTAFFGYILGQVIVDAATGQHSGRLFNVLYAGDLFSFLWLPVIGTLFVSKEYMSWSMLSDEPYLKKMKFYRSWAIPLNVVVWGRMLNMIVCVVVSFIGFAAVLMYSSWPELSGQWSMSAFISYLVVLFAYTIAMGGVNPYMEFAFNGKALLVFTILYFTVGAALLAGLAGLLGRPVYSVVMEWTTHYPIMSACVALIVAGVGIGLFKWLLYRRLSRMDFI